MDTEPQFLPSLIMEEKWDNEDFPALAIKAPHLGSSQRTRGGCPQEKGDSLFSKKWDAKGYYVQYCIRTNSLQWETDRLCHVKRRIMIYLCGGYKGKAENE